MAASNAWRQKNLNIAKNILKIQTFFTVGMVPFDQDNLLELAGSGTC